MLKHTSLLVILLCTVGCSSMFPRETIMKGYDFDQDRNVMVNIPKNQSIPDIGDTISVIERDYYYNIGLFVRKVDYVMIDDSPYFLHKKIVLVE